MNPVKQAKQYILTDTVHSQCEEEKEYAIWVLSKVTSDKDAGFRIDVDGKAIDKEKLLWKAVSTRTLPRHLYGIPLEIT